MKSGPGCSYISSDLLEETKLVLYVVNPTTLVSDHVISVLKYILLKGVCIRMVSMMMKRIIYVGISYIAKQLFIFMFHIIHCWTLSVDIFAYIVYFTT